MFESDIYNIVKLLMPVQLRKVKLLAWMNVFVKPIVDLKNVFVTYRYDSLFQLKHSSQVIYIQHILNYYLNPNSNAKDPNYEGNGIYLTDDEIMPETYLYRTSEQQQETYLYMDYQQLGDLFIYSNLNYLPYIGFIVNVPSAFNVDEKRLRAIIKKFKLAGKNYTIKYY